MLILGRCLFEGGVHLKIGCDKEIFSFKLTVYFLSVRKFYSNLKKRLSIVTIRLFLERDLKGRAVKYNHFELKNISLDENKFPMLC